MPDGSHGIYAKPRALQTFEIPDFVEQYRRAAINAIEAGNVRCPNIHDFHFSFSCLACFSLQETEKIMSSIGLKGQNDLFSAVFMPSCSKILSLKMVNLFRFRWN